MFEACLACLRLHRFRCFALRPAGGSHVPAELRRFSAFVEDPGVRGAVGAVPVAADCAPAVFGLFVFCFLYPHSAVE